MKQLFLLTALSFTFVSTLIFTGCSSDKETSSSKKQIYEWRIYTLTEEGAILDDFFKETLIPAYNRCEISVGAFSLYIREEKEQRYLLFVYPDLKTYDEVRQTVWNDREFLDAARPFFETSAPNPVYSAFETPLFLKTRQSSASSGLREK